MFSVLNSLLVCLFILSVHEKTQDSWVRAQKYHQYMFQNYVSLDISPKKSSKKNYASSICVLLQICTSCPVVLVMMNNELLIYLLLIENVGVEVNPLDITITNICALPAHFSIPKNNPRLKIMFRKLVGSYIET